MKPTVGRIVHYHFGDGVRPAIITHVWGDHCVNLHVFWDAGDEQEQEKLTSVNLNSDDVNFGTGSCSWPPRAS